MNPIYCKYSNDRDKKFRIKTYIKVDDNGNKSIYKSPANALAKEHVLKMYDNYLLMCKSLSNSNFMPNKCEMEGEAVKFEFLSQKTVESYLDDFYSKGKYFELIEVIKNFRDQLYGLESNIDFVYTDQFEKVFGCNYAFSGDKSLEVSNIDLVFGNILLSDKYTIIDYEWIFDFPVPLEFIFFRTLYYYVHGTSKREKLIEYNVFELLGITEDKKAVYFEMERNFQKYVAGRSATLNSLKATMLRCRNRVATKNISSNMEYLQIYPDYGQGFNEDSSIKKYFNYDDGKVCAEFNIGKELFGLRIDPANSGIILSDLKVSLDDAPLNIMESNAFIINSNVMAFGNNNPQVLFNVDIKGYTLKVEYDVLAINDKQLDSLIEAIATEKSSNDLFANNQNLEIENLRIIVDEKENEKINILDERNKIIIERDNVVAEKNRIVAERDRIVAEKHASDVRCADYEAYINNLRSKFVWRVASNIKKFFRSLKNYGLINTLIKVARKIKNKLFKKKQENIVVEVPVVSSPAVTKLARPGVKYMLIVVHEAQKAGGSLLSLSIVQTIKRVSCFEPVVLMISGGPLMDEFKKKAITYELNWPGFAQVYDEEQINNVFNELKQFNLQYALCNCVVTGIVAEKLVENNIKFATMVHELPTSIREYNFVKAAENAAKYSADMIFAAEFVKEKFIENYPYPEEYCHIIPQGVYSKFMCNSIEEKNKYKVQICEKFGVGEEAKFVLGCGYGNFRKGLDWFGIIAINAMKRDEKLHFIWLGEKDAEFSRWISNDLKVYGLESRFHWMGYVDNAKEYFVGADVFLLSSREDPFPSVVLDAMKSYTPVIAFDGAGGIPEILENQCGISVEYGDCVAVVDEIQNLINNSQMSTDIANNAKKSLEGLTIQKYVKKLLSVVVGDNGFEKTMPDLKVSVVIPNYNYERYIPERLESILNQTIKPYEIIFLDDVSKDNSVEVAEEILKKSGFKYQIITNEVNQGCFKQWLNGKNAASGDLIWIAEADDVCEPDFIERLLPYFNDDQVNLAYGQSEVIYEDGEHSGYIYTEYTKDLDEEKWKHDYVSNGETEIIAGLGIKNTIPNASSVIMRKSAMAGLDDVLCNYTISGDWLGYVYTLKNGKIAFCSDVLNYHRRHRNSIIHQKEQDIRMFLELMDIKLFIADNFMIPEGIKDRFLNHIKDEYNRLVTDKSKLFENQKQLMVKYNDLQKIVNDKIEKYPYLQNSPQKKILFVIPDFEMGGGQTLVVRLANYFSRFHKVFVYNARPWLYEERIANMLDSKVTVLDSIGNPEELREYVVSNQIDIINDHIWWSDKIVYKAVHDLDTKIILSMHGCYEALLEHPEWDEEFEALVDKIMERANQIIYATDKNKAVFNRVNVNEKIHQIYYGYELESIPTKERKDINISEKSFVFGLVARGIQQKGFGEAIEAFLKLKNNCEVETDLILIGNGEYIDKLKDKYSDSENIHFVDGLKKPSEWIGYVKMFDCAMLPTYFISESLPNSIIEYLAYGKPVISTDIGDIKYMLLKDEHKAGILLELKEDKVDVDDLSNAMSTMLNDKEQYDEYLMGAKELFKQFDIRNFANNYYKLFVE